MSGLQAIASPRYHRLSTSGVLPPFEAQNALEHRGIHDWKGTMFNVDYHIGRFVLGLLYVGC